MHPGRYLRLPPSEISGIILMDTAQTGKFGMLDQSDREQ